MQATDESMHARMEMEERKRREETQTGWLLLVRINLNKVGDPTPTPRPAKQAPAPLVTGYVTILKLNPTTLSPARWIAIRVALLPQI